LTIERRKEAFKKAQHNAVLLSISEKRREEATQTYLRKHKAKREQLVEFESPTYSPKINSNYKLKSDRPKLVNSVPNRRVPFAPHHFRPQATGKRNVIFSPQNRHTQWCRVEVVTRDML
jgi:hypothetical protein